MPHCFSSKAAFVSVNLDAFRFLFYRGGARSAAVAALGVQEPVPEDVGAMRKSPRVLKEMPQHRRCFVHEQIMLSDQGKAGNAHENVQS